MSEYSSLAIEFKDWYDKSYYTYKKINSNEYHEKITKEAENIIKGYLGDSMYDMGIDEAIDELPEKGRLEIEEFLNSHRSNKVTLPKWYTGKPMDKGIYVIELKSKGNLLLMTWSGSYFWRDRDVIVPSAVEKWVRIL